MNRKIFIIIVTYNGSKWIKKCLNSALNSTVETTVIVVDNNSSDDTVEIIKNEFEEVILVEKDENLGFGKANNIGLQVALENGGDLFLLLNQDAYLDQDTIEKLSSRFEEDSKYGILSPVHLDGKGTQIDIYFKLYLSHTNCPNLYADKFLNKELQPIYEAKFVNAAIWMISRRTLKVVGGFNPYFFHYAEDNDYVNRCHFKGISIGVVPDSYAYHDRSQEYRGRRNNRFENTEDLKLMNPNRSFTYKKMLKFTFKKSIKTMINRDKQGFVNATKYLKKLYANRKEIVKTKEEVLSGNYPFLDFKD